LTIIYGFKWGELVMAGEKKGKELGKASRKTTPGENARQGCGLTGGGPL